MTTLHTRVVEAMARAMWIRAGGTGEGFALIFALLKRGERVKRTSEVEELLADAQAALTAAVSALAAEGWGVRPDVATEGMLLACAPDSLPMRLVSKGIYETAAAAAPSPFGESGE